MACSQNKYQYLPEIFATNEGDYFERKKAVRERGQVIIHNVTKMQYRKETPRGSDGTVYAQHTGPERFDIRKTHGKKERRDVRGDHQVLPWSILAMILDTRWGRV